MDADRLNELLAMIEKAEGPDRELDAQVGVALGFFVKVAPRYSGDGQRYAEVAEGGNLIVPGQAGDMLVPHYSDSIDAALALVERCLPGWGWHFGRPLHDPQFHTGGVSEYYGEVFRARAQDESLIPTGGGRDWLTSRYAPTAPLAILLALFRALIANQTQESA